MAWVVLFVAGILEIVWATAMKQSDGFTKLTPTVITFVAMTTSVVLLAYSMRSLPLGTAYAVWTGVGAFGAFVIGILVLGEAATPMRLVSAGLILLGIIGLKLASA